MPFLLSIRAGVASWIERAHTRKDGARSLVDADSGERKEALRQPEFDHGSESADHDALQQHYERDVDRDESPQLVLEFYVQLHDSHEALHVVGRFEGDFSLLETAELKFCESIRLCHSGRDSVADGRHPGRVQVGRGLPLRTRPHAAQPAGIVQRRRFHVDQTIPAHSSGVQPVPHDGSDGSGAPDECARFLFLALKPPLSSD